MYLLNKFILNPIHFYIIFFYAIIYFICFTYFKDGFNITNNSLVDKSNDKNKNNYSNNIINSIYYSFVTQSTIGYGDIYPIKWWSKLIVITQIILVLTAVFNV